MELAGSFTNWQPLKMRKVKDGFTRTLDLPLSGDQEFRYHIDGVTWENDHSADTYVATGVDLEENSVVTI